MYSNLFLLCEEVLPPHFQFLSLAKWGDCEQICLELIQFMKNVIVKFGHDEAKIFPCTFGLNEKGGMDKEAFEKYFSLISFPFIQMSLTSQAKGF